jgi:hypothetical protein
VDCSHVTLLSLSLGAKVTQLTTVILMSCVVCLQLASDRKYQHYLDRSTLYHRTRWTLFAVLLMAYCVRVFFLNGWYIVTYSLGIYLLNLFIGFLSPPVSCSAYAMLRY